jgi:DNA polymerase I-like protein with 3'-5' exonuclease and polymerase domains
MKCILDVETDGLLNEAHNVHCIVAYDIDNKKPYVFKLEECQAKFRHFAKSVSQFIMHNGLSFDAPVLNKLCGTQIKDDSILDTLILSQLFNPMREGGHSLESWGERFKLPKGSVESFVYYTEDMLEYCKQDVNITYKLYNYLKDEGSKFSKRSIDLEHKIRRIINDQEDCGFYLDIPYATTFMASLQDRSQDIYNQLQEVFPPIVTTGRVHKTSGKPLKDIIEPFNPSSRKQIGERLIELGWEPTKKTDKGNVIVDEDVLSTIDMNEAKLISEYLLLQKRHTQIASWVEAVKTDGRVHGRVLTLRTVTGRMAHTSPNMAQVPAVYSPFGKECRTCWTVENKDTHSLVGTDASGLELRGLAHFMNDPKFTEEILNGDVHTANQKMAGLETRDQAKTFIYALMYGAGAAKIGSIVGGDAKTGERLISKFMGNMPKFSLLKNKLTEASESGIIRGLDGRLLHIRSPHASLNTLIQGSGAVICKQWLVQMTDKIQESGVDAKLVASVHDEYQFEVANDDTEKFGTITNEAIKEVEEIYNLNCPLDSEFKIGKNWAETH